MSKPTIKTALIVLTYSILTLSILGISLAYDAVVHSKVDAKLANVYTKHAR